MGQAGVQQGLVGQRRSLVVGASSTIGTAISRVVAARSSSIELWGRDAARLDEAVRACRAAEPAAEVIADTVDVSDPEILRAAWRRFAAAGPCTTIVWAAGTFDWATADRADADRWRTVFDSGLTAAAELTALAAPLLVSSTPATLVFLGSGAGHVVFPGNAAYVAAKHGLVALARATYLDLRAYGVRVSVISPGPVAAGATLNAGLDADTIKQLLTPEDVAGAVAYVLDFPAHGCPTEIVLQPHVAPPT